MPANESHRRARASRQSALTHKPDTVFSLLTDDQTAFRKYSRSCKMRDKKLQIVLLERGVITAKSIRSAADSDRKTSRWHLQARRARRLYKKRSSQQQWNCLCQGAPTSTRIRIRKISSDGRQSFTLQNAESKQYLALDQGCCGNDCRCRPQPPEMPILSKLRWSASDPGCSRIAGENFHLKHQLTDLKAFPTFNSVSFGSLRRGRLRLRFPTPSKCSRPSEMAAPFVRNRV